MTERSKYEHVREKCALLLDKLVGRKVESLLPEVVLKLARALLVLMSEYLICYLEVSL